MPELRTLIPFVLVVALSATAASARAEGAIQVVGSSTVYPFTAVVGERFSQITGGRAPTIEATGSGGGMKLFCAGVGDETPDITNASRRMKKSEQTECNANGVGDVIEIKIGYDGIVLAQSLSAAEIQLTRSQLYYALARQIPDANGDLMDNPNKTWRDVDENLPATPIQVYGPPPTSGTRDAFVELVLEHGCKNNPHMAAFKHTDTYKALCHSVREDGAYIEVGENDNLIIQKLSSAPNALGIFGFSFLAENRDVVRGLAVEKIAPEFETIADASYPVSRPLFIYVKKAHFSVVDELADFVEFFVQEEVMGEDGFLAERGLILLSPDEYADVLGAVENQQAMKPL